MTTDHPDLVVAPTPVSAVPQTLVEALRAVPDEPQTISTAFVAPDIEQRVFDARPVEPPPGRRAPTTDDGGDFIEIDCPGCGTPWSGPRPTRPSGRSFCASCDYPLFLAITPPPRHVDESTETARRRRPGVDGKERLGMLACPWCGEPNLPEAGAHCVRCHGPMTMPPPPPPPQIVVQREEVMVTEVDLRWRTIALVLGGAFVLTLTALLAVVLG